MNALLPLKPPFLVFPDQAGGFLVFAAPCEVFAGAELAAAEAQARRQAGWLAGGLQYAAAESSALGWWGVFERPYGVTREDLELLADRSPVVTGPLVPVLSHAQYDAGFERVRAALATGLSYQVNLTFPLEGLAVSGSPWSWRAALRLWLDVTAAQGREAVFAALGDEIHAEPLLVSASPELFFSREGSTVRARPMKGTALRNPDSARDALLRHELATSPKTRAENLMVTDMLRNDLGRVALPGGVTVPQLFEVEAYPTVWQMTSTVQAEVEPDLSLSSLMEALFPCASITGAPKVSTQAVIAEAEPISRGWYTGTLGWHRPPSAIGGQARSRFSVLIRTLVFDSDPGAFRLGVGGGVVWDSTAEAEWQEAWAKTRFLANTARAFDLTEALLWEPGSGWFLLPEHEARLAAACRDFGGPFSPSELRSALDNEVSRLLSAGLAGPFKVRVLVDPQFRVSVHAEPVSSQPDELTAALAPRPLGPESLLWRRYKTSDRRVYTENQVEGVDQTLYYNERGELTESTTMTLVLEEDGEFVTPALSCGLLAGTYRDRLLTEGQLREAILPIARLATADQVWLVNSVRKWKRVRLVGG